MKLNKLQLAAKLGVSARTISRWGAAGMPTGNGKMFDLADVLAWVESAESGLSRVDLDTLKSEAAAVPADAVSLSFFQQFQKARSASETERAILLRLERQKLEGSLVDSQSVRRAAFNTGRQAQQSIMSLRHRLDPLLVGETNSAKRAALWDRELRLICSEMAKTRGDQLATVAPEH